MSAIEERLSAALQARAESIDLTEPAPGLPESDRPGHRRIAVIAAAAAAAVVAVVGTIAVATQSGDDARPSPAPAPTSPTGTPTPGTPNTPDRAEGTLQSPFLGDVDGDGVDDEVFISDGVLAANLDTDRTASKFVGRKAKLVGLADVESDRLLALLDDGRILRFADNEKVANVQTGGYFFTRTWLGDDRRLLTGTDHEWDGKTYITAYRWTRKGTELEPTGDAMYCPDPAAADAVPIKCGAGDRFVGDGSDLPELQPAPYSTVGIGEGEVTAAINGYDGTTARLEGSTDSEVGAGDVELVVGDARIGLPAGAAPRVISASFPAGDGIAFAVERRIGDSFGYELYRYDGSSLTAIDVPKVDGLNLQGGGPAGGGPYTEVFLSNSGGFYTLWAESGIDLYQKAVAWKLKDDRMVGTEIGPVCLDSLVLELDVPDAYGACDFG